jgi:hypothetical protein
MLCPVVPLQLSGKFKGDGEAMLSALIKACEVKPISPAANPAWAGRELVPWTDDSVQVERCLEFQPLEANSRWATARVVSNGEAADQRLCALCGSLADSVDQLIVRETQHDSWCVLGLLGWASLLARPSATFASHGTRGLAIHLVTHAFL